MRMLLVLFFICSCKLNTAEVILPPQGIVSPDIKGTLDPNFGNNGFVRHNITPGITTPYIAKDQSTSMRVLSGGDILISGQGSAFSGASNGDGFFLNLTSNGSRDILLNNSGIEQVRDTGFLDRGLAAYSNGNHYYLAGGSRTSSSPSSSECYLKRFYPEGTPDVTFGTAGVVSTNLGGTFCYFHDVVVTSQNKIAVAYSYFPPALAAVRYGVVVLNQDGSVDSNFATSGQVNVHLNSINLEDYGLLRIQELSDGKLVIVGSYFTTSSTTSTFIVRLLANGSFDTTFGTVGKLLISQGTSNSATDFLIDGDTILLPLTYRTSSSSPFFGALHKYNWNGAPISNFGTSGRTIIETSYQTHGYRFNSITKHNDMYFIGGSYAYQVPGDPLREKALVIAYDETGKRISTFGTSGVFTYEPLINSRINTVRAHSSKLIACGEGGVSDSDEDIICLRLE
jgi:uncharacterized delta-60 repeat protein